MNVYGLIVTAHDVADAVVENLRAWSPAYIAEISASRDVHVAVRVACLHSVRWMSLLSSRSSLKSSCLRVSLWCPDWVTRRFEAATGRTSPSGPSVLESSYRVETKSPQMSWFGCMQQQSSGHAAAPFDGWICPRLPLD